MEILRRCSLLIVLVLGVACTANAPSLRVVGADAPSVLAPKGRVPSTPAGALSKNAGPALELTSSERQASPPNTPAEPSEACVLPVKEKHPAGLYPSDVMTKGEVVLTFDDGPHPGKTPKVLDLLAKHQLVATFFLVGHNIRRDTYTLVQRMVAEGHSLGSHTYNHDVGMAVRNHGEKSIEYIRGEHETTRVLIELALLASSPDDFDALFTRVFDRKTGTYLPAASLRSEWQSFAARHAEVLAERGYTDGRRPYAIVYSRPPAGTPYVGLSTRDQQKLYDSALARLGFLNIMWHGESGDTNPQRKTEFSYLTENLAYHSRRGGVILIHDYIRTDALSAALGGIAKNPNVHVVPMASALKQKYGCGTALLARTLSGLGTGAVAAK